MKQNIHIQFPVVYLVGISQTMRNGLAAFQ